MKNVYFCGLTVCLLFSGLNALAADDAYMQMLEGEAEKLELDQSGQLQHDTAAKVRNNKHLSGREGFGWKGSLDGETLPSGLQYEEFESILQENFYGTFLFYNKLSSTDKRTVYYRYKKAASTSLENVRKNILDLIKR